MDKDAGLSDMNRLHDGFIAAMRGSSWKEEPQRFEIDELSELTKLSNEIEKRTYRTSKGVEFELNERGKTRHIHGGRIRDRTVRHALCDTELRKALHPCLIYNNGASQNGKGLTFAREMFERDLHNFWLKYRTNEGYVGLIDISKFYDNIRHDYIRNAIYPRIGEEAQWLMDEVLRQFRVDVSYMTDEEYADCINQKFDSVKYYETIPTEMRTGEKFMLKGVDIGDQVSQEIGIFFPTPIDNYVKIVRGCKWYGRYMDDMYIICKDKDELKSIIDGITAEANALGMFINEKKTRIVKLSDTFKFLQIKYNLTATGKVVKRINPQNLVRERRRLKAYKRQMDKGKMKYEDIEQACKSWFGNYAKLMSKDQIRRMKRLYKDLFGKEISWKQKSSSTTKQKSKPKKTEPVSSQTQSPTSPETCPW